MQPLFVAYKKIAKISTTENGGLCCVKGIIVQTTEIRQLYCINILEMSTFVFILQ